MEDLDNKLLGLSLIAQEKLQAIICSIPGKKDLIIESCLIKPLEKICSASWLKLKGIQRIYKFDVDNSVQCSNAADQILAFMISSRVQAFNHVLDYIQKQQSTTASNSADISTVKSFHIICVPNCFSQFAVLLEARGLYGFVQLHRFNWDFISVDKGVLSLEIPYVFPTVFLNRDTSILPSIAQSLRIFHVVCGRPDLTLTFGTNSSNIARMLKALKPLGGKANETPSQTNIMCIIDRDKDYASSLLTPSIYAGLLLEVFRCTAGELIIEANINKIQCQKLKLFQLEPNADKVSSTVPKESKPARMRLNSQYDEIYDENRYKHFTQVSGLIRTQAKTIGIELQKLNDMKIDEMHEYVARKLPKITDLKTKILRHLNACEKIIEMLANNFLRIRSLEEDILNNISRKKILQEIDELLTTDGQRYNTLRLLCLMQLSAGLDSEELAAFMLNYCNYFGAKHLMAFQCLTKGGLLPELQAEKVKKVSATKLLSNLSIPKFQQTEFQANSNRLRLMTSSSSDTSIDTQTSSTSGNSGNSTTSCPSYVFNGLYIPLVAQICALMAKFSNIEDFVSKFGMLDMELHANDIGTIFTPKSYANAVKQNELRDIFPIRNAHFFVYVVGGVTYAEIAACNLIERTTGTKIIILSDSIISGSDLIESAF